MAWFDLIPTCGFKQTMHRAHSALKLTTHYKLGEGGFNPIKPLTPQCDCSGFIAWAIGIPREFPPGSNKWLSTTEYYAGGAPVLPGLLSQVELHQARAGDLLVYPHQNGQVGHIALISEVSDGQPAGILHCSSGNYKNFGNRHYPRRTPGYIPSQFWSEGIQLPPSSHNHKIAPSLAEKIQ